MNAAHIDTQAAGAGTPTANNATDAPSPKDFATVQTQLAIRGHQLIHDHNPLTGQHDYLINRCGWTRYFTKWADVVAFAEQIGGRA